MKDLLQAGICLPPPPSPGPGSQACSQAGLPPSVLRAPTLADRCRLIKTNLHETSGLKAEKDRVFKEGPGGIVERSRPLKIHALAGGLLFLLPAPPGVMPIRLFPPKDPRLKKRAARVYRAALDQARYLLGGVHPWKRDPRFKLLTASKSGEHWIRPNTSSAEGFAFLCRFGPYDAGKTGISRKKLFRDVLVPMLRYLAATHVTGSKKTGDGKPWGDAWQSAYWAYSLGRAAWYTWDRLPEDLRRGVRRVVAHEADRFVGKTPPHRVEADTKAEENAWNSTVLSAAILLMPSDPRRKAWEKTFRTWALSSFLRPSDEHSKALLDGRPLSEQFTGANIHDDFTLENHGMVHPDYMATFALSLGCAADFAMTGRTPPGCLFFNAAGLYENLKWFTLPSGGFVYPAGQDWRLFRDPDWLYTHVLMAVFGGDPDAWSLAGACLDTLERMQARSPSGAIYAGGEYFFPSTQHSIFRALTRTWLLLHLGRSVLDRPRTRTGVLRLDAGRIVLNRTPRALHTFAWGARILAQFVPLRKDRLVSPDPRNGIGAVHLAGKKGALPLRLRKVRVTRGADWFQADLVVDHGKEVRAGIRFRSNPDGTMLWEETLSALRDCRLSRVATGVLGVLNDKGWVYEKGFRILSRDRGKAVKIPSCSGKVLDLSGAGRITLDSLLRVESDTPLRARYEAARAPRRARVTDLLVLNYVPCPLRVEKGQEISRYRVRISCR